MNFIRNRNFRAGPQTSLEGFICPQNSDKQQKNKVFGRSGGGVIIGNNSGISATNINCNVSVTIGSHVLIGAGCLITDSNHHSINWRQRCFEGDSNVKSAPITICDYVFIGARSIILKGVTIGEKSIIAAGSVVVTDIPANCIAGGNPCKVIKFLK